MADFLSIMMFYEGTIELKKASNRKCYGYSLGSGEPLEALPAANKQSMKTIFKKTNVRLKNNKVNITKNKMKFNLSESEKLVISKFCEEDIELYNEIKQSI